MVCQVLSQYEAKDDRMGAYLSRVNEIKQTFNKFNIEQIPREKNVIADLLANLAIHLRVDKQQSVSLEYQKQPSIYRCELSVNCSNSINEEDWRTPFLKYLKE